MCGVLSNVVNFRKISTIQVRYLYFLSKNMVYPKKNPEERYVAQEYNGKEKVTIVHKSSTLRALLIKTILFVASVYGFFICSYYFTQAYLKSKDKLSRQIFLRPKRDDLKTFEIRPSEALELISSIYCLRDAGDFWALTMEAHLVNKLEIRPMPGEKVLYMKKMDKNWMELPVST